MTTHALSFMTVVFTLFQIQYIIQ